MAAAAPCGGLFVVVTAHSHAGVTFKAARPSPHACCGVAAPTLRVYTHKQATHLTSHPAQPVLGTDGMQAGFRRKREAGPPPTALACAQTWRLVQPQAALSVACYGRAQHKQHATPSSHSQGSHGIDFQDPPAHLPIYHHGRAHAPPPSRQLHASAPCRLSWLGLAPLPEHLLATSKHRERRRQRLCYRTSGQATAVSLAPIGLSMRCDPAMTRHRHTRTGACVCAVLFNKRSNLHGAPRHVGHKARTCMHVSAYRAHCLAKPRHPTTYTGVRQAAANGSRSPRGPVRAAVPTPVPEHGLPASNSSQAKLGQDHSAKRQTPKC